MQFLKPAWLVAHGVVVVLAVLFVGLGFWQLQRLDQRQARNELLQARLGLELQPLHILLQQFSTDAPPAHPDSVAYRPTSVSGAFDPQFEVLLRSTENYNGNPGYYLLTPLVLDDGRALLVERGWVPFEFKVPPVAEAAPPEGEVDLTGVITLERPTYEGWLSALAPRDPPGELDITAYIDTERLEAQMPYELLPVYLELRTQQPPQDAALPLPNLEPEFTDGPHLGYAVQWFSFALIGVVGYGLLLRQLAREGQKRLSAEPA